MVLTAKRRILSLLVQRVILLIYNKNKMGHKFDPCGTPKVIDVREDNALL